MRSLPRILAGVAALAALSLTAGACDTSPVAASVNGREIKQTQVNAELSQLSANAKYIQFIENQSGGSIHGLGTGTYNSGWTAYVLSDIVSSDIVRQYLARTGHLPDGAMVTDARAVNSAFYPDWEEFPAAYRTTLTQRTADLATLEGSFAEATQINTYYKEFSTRLFRQVCVRSAAISVTSASGAVDYPSSLAKAKGVVAGLAGRAGVRRSSATLPGTLTCYDPMQLEGQAPGFVSTVLGLQVGAAAAPEKTAYGYQVLEVASRSLLPLDAAMRAAISVGVYLGEVTTKTAAVLSTARVTIDPQYGAWTGSAKTSYRVEPPSAPSS